MNKIPKISNNHEAYHAHIYFDVETVATAKLIYAQITDQFDVQLGRLHEKPVGPHTKGMFQVAFVSSDFNEILPWLEAHRKSLAILIHALSGDDLQDHTKITN